MAAALRAFLGTRTREDMPLADRREGQRLAAGQQADVDDRPPVTDLSEEVPRAGTAVTRRVASPSVNVSSAHVRRPTQAVNPPRSSFLAA